VKTELLTFFNLCWSSSVAGSAKVEKILGLHTKLKAGFFLPAGKFAPFFLSVFLAGNLGANLPLFKTGANFPLFSF
jgi:hypothetical protein